MRTASRGTRASGSRSSGERHGPWPHHTRPQEIRFGIELQLGNYLESKRCRVYPTPFKFRLFERVGDCPEDTVVDPDIFVVCDSDKFDEDGCKGVLDLIVGVRFSSTHVKLNLYHQAGYVNIGSWIRKTGQFGSAPRIGHCLRKGHGPRNMRFISIFYAFYKRMICI